jgi:hypothetical protein
MNIQIFSRKINFNTWINLFYITLENFILMINEIVSKSEYVPSQCTNQENKKKQIFQNTSIELGDLSQLKKTIGFKDQSSLALSVKDESISKQYDNLSKSICNINIYI